MGRRTGANVQTPTTAATGRPASVSGVIVEAAVGGLLLLALWRFVPDAPPAWRTSVVLVVVLTTVFVLGRSVAWSERALPALMGLALVFLVEQANAFGAAWEVPGLTSRSLAPAVLLALLVGAVWMLSEPHDSRQRAWNLTLLLAVAGVTVWAGVTTLVIARQALVDVSLNAGQVGKLLLFLILFGGAYTASADNRALCQRLVYYTLSVYLIGLVRVAL